MFDWKAEVAITILGLVAAGAGAIAGNAWKRRRTSDRELFLLLRQACDRPAFRGPFVWQSDQAAFRQAIAMTLKTIETGKYLDRKGNELGDIQGRYLGPSSMRNTFRRHALEKTRDQLQKIEWLSGIARSDQSQPASDLPQLIDEARDAAIRSLNDVWKELGIPIMELPTDIKLYEQTRDPGA